jgi:hypothetical protein
MTPWYDTVDWATDPRLAYAKGLHDGYTLGHDAANTEIVATLAQALGGPDCTDYRHGVRRHLRTLDAKTRREHHDQAHTANRRRAA